jgi:superfamily II DNA or RNA helicase
MQLRPYQIEALQAVHDAFERGIHRQLLSLPTGAGKTVVFAELVRQRPGRTLVLAHRDRLIEQAHAKLSIVIDKQDLGIIKGPVNHVGARTIVASVQTLGAKSGKRLATFEPFDTIIIDEAHRSAAPGYLRVLERAFDPSRTLLLGVTATPNRTDGIGLSKVYDEIVYSVDILSMIGQGYLAPLTGYRVVLDTDFSGLRTKRGLDGIRDFDESQVAEMMSAANWVEHLAQAWLKYARDRRTIAFVPRVAMAYRLCEHLRELGIRAEALDGTTDTRIQREVVRRFETGEVQFLANRDLFVEGADIPSIDCVVFARPTKSQIVYSQAVGRGTRLSPATGKKDCLVLDIVGATNHLSLCTLGSLAGDNDDPTQPVTVRDGETLTEAVERRKREAEEADDRERLDGQVVGKQVSLFSAPQWAPGDGAMIWRKGEQYRVEMSYLIDNKPAYAVVRYKQAYAAVKAPYSSEPRQESLGIFDRLSEARTACESHYRKQQFGGPNARWRQEPATEKQIALLNKFRVRFPSGVTKDQASELLGQIFSRKHKAASGGAR